MWKNFLIQYKAQTTLNLYLRFYSTHIDVTFRFAFMRTYAIKVLFSTLLFKHGWLVDVRNTIVRIVIEPS